MLFFFGTGNTRVSTTPLPNLACAHCGTVGSVSTTVFSRYFHFFWIPAFPIGKTSVTVCQHCKQTLTLGEMPEAYRPPVYTLQAQARTPLTNFALLLLAGLAVVLIMGLVLFGPRKPAAAAADKTPAAEPATAATPPDPASVEATAGTRYKVNLADGGRKYALVEVTKVTPDSVYFRMTGALSAELTDAGVSMALRDSVPPMDARRALSKLQWHYSTTGQGLFKRLD